jgi:hypothetical protein
MKMNRREPMSVGGHQERQFEGAFAWIVVVSMLCMPSQASVSGIKVPSFCLGSFLLFLLWLIMCKVNHLQDDGTPVGALPHLPP